VSSGVAAGITSTDAEVTRCITQRMACTLNGPRARPLGLLVAAAACAGAVARLQRMKGMRLQSWLNAALYAVCSRQPFCMWRCSGCKLSMLQDSFSTL
jgi:hypothetical protein